MLPIYDITKFTLLDYPGQISCIIWFTGCNYKCEYCYNKSLMKIQKKYDESDIINFLMSRVGKLDGVVLSGGECTLYDITPIIIKIKELGFFIKIDTNGSNDKRLKELLNKELLDYVALDYKSPLHIYDDIVGVLGYKLHFIDSLNMLIHSNINFEVRSTLCKDLTVDHIIDICKDLNHRNYTGVYYVQNNRSEPWSYDTPTNIIQKIKDISFDMSFKIVFRNF